MMYDGQYGLRKDATTGVINYTDDRRQSNAECHFSEWYSGEGVDVSFSYGSKDYHYSLSLEDMTCLVAIASVLNMVDMEEVENIARNLRSTWTSKNGGTDVY